MSFTNLVFTALIAIAPGVAAWWTGRGLGRTADDPALPELLLARNQRVVPVIAGSLALLIVLSRQVYWGIALLVVSLLIGSFPLRRALGLETVSLDRYLWRSVKSIVGSVGFWILLAWTPQLVLTIEPRYRPAALLLLPVLLLWEWRYPQFWLWLHDSVLLVDEALSPRIAAIVERAGIPAPALYRIGGADARFTNAFAFPSVRQPAIGLGNKLIELLDPDELAAIYAHELAHIEHFSPRRIRRLQLLNRVLIFLAIGLPFAAQAFVPGVLTWVPIVWPAIVILAMVVRARTRQQEEHESDLRAAALCGDPEAVVRGLIKVHVHGFLPRRWPVDFERNASHPSLARRIQALRGDGPGSATSRAFGAPVVLHTAREGTVVALDDARGYWFDGVPDGTPAELEALRSAASSARSVAWGDLIELRVAAKGAERSLRATHRNGDAWSVPLSATQISDVQRALDAVDVRLHRELGKRPVPAVRLVAALTVLALFVTLQLGIVLVPAALALFWPGVASAAALGVSALLLAGLNFALDEGPAYFITPAVGAGVLGAIGVVALWLAWRAHRAGPRRASDRFTVGAMGVVVLPVLLASVSTARGLQLSQLADSPWLTTLCVASGGLAAALLAGSARWARWTGLATAALALVAGATRLRAARSDAVMTRTAVNAMESGRMELEGTITDMRLSPAGTRYLLQRFEEGPGRRQPTTSYLVGAFDSAQRALTALDAAFIDEQHILVLRLAGDSLQLQLERANADSALWTAPLPDLYGPRLVVSPRDGRWVVTGTLAADSMFAGSGTMASPAIRARQLAPPPDESGEGELLVLDGGAKVIATTFDLNRQLPAPLMMFGLSTPRVLLWEVTPGERQRVGELPGYPQCGAADGGRAVCFVRARTRGLIYSLGADGVPRSHGALPNAATYLVVPGPGPRLTATDRGDRVLDVDTDAGRITEIRLPAGSGFLMTAGVAGERLAVVWQDSTGARMIWYRMGARDNRASVLLP